MTSHLLGRIARRFSACSQAKYGHPIYLLEPERSGDRLLAGQPARATAGGRIFVDTGRFAGACYRAAN